MERALVLIKLGGSIITDKTQPFVLRVEVLKRLIAELVEARKQLPTTDFIVGHGHGSFGHVPAVEFGIKRGFVPAAKKAGVEAVLSRVAELNGIVVNECNKSGLAAESFRVSEVVQTTNGMVTESALDTLQVQLANQVVPVTCGDILVDTQQGYVLWSTEEVLAFLAQKLRTRWDVQRIIQVTDVEGVLDSNEQCIPLISAHSWLNQKPQIGEAGGFDISGGMVHKVEASLELAKQGIGTQIISGMQPGNVYNTLIDHTVNIGTKIV